MAHLTKQEVLDLAILAKIELSDDEVIRFQGELVEILNFVETLNKVDTSALPPTDQVTGLYNVMRSDKVVNYHINRDDILSNVPSVVNNQIKVKKVL